MGEKISGIDKWCFLGHGIIFLGFPPPEAAEVRSTDRRFPGGKTYAVCTLSPGRRHCNKLGTQAPRRGMLCWPIPQHCSNFIALLGDCSNS